MQLIDAHTHTEEQSYVRLLKREKIYATINCGTPAEFTRNQSWVGNSRRLRLSAGIHPWQVDQVAWTDMALILAQVPVIGEIGLDNVWTKTDPQLQQQIFTKQLAYAEQAHKPVIIHTKGMEQETLRILKTYFNTYLLHWYSSTEYIEDYLALGCYFSIGPSFATEESVHYLLNAVPLNRVLLESDGMDSIAWALNQELPLSAYPRIMDSGIQALSQAHHVAPNQVAAQLVDNLQRFWAGDSEKAD